MGDDGCGGVAGCFDMSSLTSKPETALNSTHLDSRWDNFPIRVPKVLRQHKMKHDKTYFILTQPSAFSPKNRTQDNNRSQPKFLMKFSL